MNKKILIVDDEPQNISLLIQSISQTENNLLVARNGNQAISIALTAQPDLILLDVMMSPIDGFSVCEKLKKNHLTAKIPVIFMTALDGTDEKIRAFNAGAADYVIKPFQVEELLARIKTHIDLYSYQKQLQEQKIFLEKANQKADFFAQAVAHDLKNSVNLILGFSSLALEDLKLMDLQEQPIANFLTKIEDAGKKMIGSIDSLLLLSKISSKFSQQKAIDYEVLDMGKIVSEVINHRLASTFMQNKVQIDMPEEWYSVKSYRPWVEEVWLNYLSNAVKYGGTPPQLQLGSEKHRDSDERCWVCYWVQDNGNGLRPEQQVKLFEPFIRLDKNRAEGHGLGLAIVKEIIQQLDGKFGVESTNGSGSRFYFCLKDE